MSATVTLTRDEMLFGAQTGALRQIDALLKGRRHYFDPPNAWKNDINGVLSEMAFAKFRDLYWFPCYDDPSKVEADVGRNWQVRSVDRPDGKLVVRARDRDDQAFVLAVLDELPVVRFPGWVWGREAKRDEYARPAENGRPPAWFVSQTALRPFDSNVTSINRNTNRREAA